MDAMVATMFDIYTIQGDGTPLLVETVSCQSLAQKTAYQLSVLFPGESFVYSDRSEERADLPVMRSNYAASSPAYIC
jgi:hypothetical protein